MKKRTIFNVRWGQPRKRWAFRWLVRRSSGYLEASSVTKADAIRIAVKRAREHQPSQVVIHTKDGRIQSERTYGDDPRRSKG